ncbi:substrate-binding periplasmic protein [Inhella sp.]|uniref:substrate-binding periplasmic protein n=1 Tax=Inhella sp. TaxID=1921806 RepID=UPI0035B25166
MKWASVRRAGLLAGLALLVAGGAAAAECGPFRVGLKLYPLVYERQSGGPGYRGLDPDFFALLGERSGCRFTLEVESLPRIWSRLRGGSLDATSWVVPTPERQAWVTVIPLARANLVALTWTAQRVRDEADFLARTALRAVVVRGASYGPEYDRLLAQLRAQGRVSEVGDFDAAVRVFFGQRVDLLLGYAWSVAAPLRERPGQVQVADWHPQAQGLSSGLALSRRSVSAADQQRLLQALRSLQADGSLERLLHQHLQGLGVRPLEDVAPQ